VGVAAARIRQDEQPRAVHGRALESRLDDRAAGAPGRGHLADDLPQDAIHRHTDEGHDVRTEAPDFLFEHRPAVEIFPRTEVIDAGARPRNQVRHPDAPLRQPDVILVRDGLRNDPRFV
jgi:hypothetical protein